MKSLQCLRRGVCRHLAAAQECGAWGASSLVRCLAAPAAAASNNLALIKELREKSGAPISDVKKCLADSNWDVERAYEALRTRGLAAAAKKASRHAAEGLVGVAEGNGTLAIAEVNSETDFVARNPDFMRFVSSVAYAALQLGPAAVTLSNSVDMEQLLASGSPQVSQSCAELVAHVRENIKVRRAVKLATTTGVLASYVHSSLAPGLGRIVSAVVIEPTSGEPLQEASRTAVQELGQNLAMHTAGLKPQYLDRQRVPQSVLEHEKLVLQAQAGGSGKSAAVIDKMVEGRLAKFCDETCLLEQRYLMDDSQKVKAVIARVSKQVGQELHVPVFVRLQCGEGLESKRLDFAAEVAATLKQ